MFIIHDDRHEGIQCLLYRLRRDFHMPNLHNVVHEFICNCSMLYQYNTKHIRVHGDLNVIAYFDGGLNEHQSRLHWSCFHEWMAIWWSLWWSTSLVSINTLSTCPPIYDGYVGQGNLWWHHVPPWYLVVHYVRPRLDVYLHILAWAYASMCHKAPHGHRLPPLVRWSSWHTNHVHLVV